MNNNSSFGDMTILYNGSYIYDHLNTPNKIVFITNNIVFHIFTSFFATYYCILMLILYFYKKNNKAPAICIMLVAASGLIIAVK